MINKYNSRETHMAISVKKQGEDLHIEGPKEEIKQLLRYAVQGTIAKIVTGSDASKRDNYVLSWALERIQAPYNDAVDFSLSEPE